MRYIIVILWICAFLTPATAQLRPMVYTETIVDAPAAEVWSDWTTEAGLEDFFAPKAVIELEPGRAYELWFLPDAEPGQRGAEDGVILGLEPERMLHFTWAMPPYMPEIRQHMTAVQILFEPISETKTRVRLFHTGFGTTKAWDKGHDYFTKVWPGVMKNYKAHKSVPEIDAAKAE